MLFEIFLVLGNRNPTQTGLISEDTYCHVTESLMGGWASSQLIWPLDEDTKTPVHVFLQELGHFPLHS